jgi:hypothetical protein
MAPSLGVEAAQGLDRAPPKRAVHHIAMRDGAYLGPKVECSSRKYTCRKYLSKVLIAGMFEELPPNLTPIKGI